MKMGIGIRRGKQVGSEGSAGRGNRAARAPGGGPGAHRRRHRRSGEPPGGREQRLHDQHQLRSRRRGRQGPRRRAPARPDRRPAGHPALHRRRSSNSATPGVDGCPANTQVGTVSVNATITIIAVPVPAHRRRGSSTTSRPQPGEPARFGIVLQPGNLGGMLPPPAPAGPGDPAVGRRAADERLRPRHRHQRHPERRPRSPLGDLPTHINSQTITLFGTAPGTGKPFSRNPTQCTPEDGHLLGDPVHGDARHRAPRRPTRRPTARPCRSRPSSRRRSARPASRRRRPSRRSRPRSSRRPTRRGSRTRSCSCRA